MKHLFARSLFALALAGCLDTPVEPPAPDESLQLDDRTTSDRQDDYVSDDVFYCVQAWELDNVCVEINVGFYQAALQCGAECARLGYANTTCARAAYWDACN